MKKFWQFFIVLIFVFVIAGCGGDKGGEQGGGGSQTGEKTCADDSTMEICKDPEKWTWQYNRSGFDGKGMQILILHGAPEELDPFNDKFTGERRNDKRSQIYDIQKQYNITIKFDKFPDAAAWGPDRVAWINNLKVNQVEDQGDIFAIASDWVPSLVAGNSIAELAKYSNSKGQSGGLFGELGYQQAREKNAQYQMAGKVYGYSNGKAHADTFLYYNQDLVNQYNLEDPATLWNEGRWEWTTFYAYLQRAQQAFDNSGEEEKIYAFGGYVNEIAQGMLSARGGKFVDKEMKKVLFTNQTTLDLYSDLRKIHQNIGWAPSSTSADVSSDFEKGHQLFAHGSMWFLSSEMRFKKDGMDFKISVVPYPTADGDGATRSNYKIPIGSDSGYAFRKVENGANGLTTKVLVNLMDDICRGLVPEFSAEDMTEEQAYITFLQKRIDSAASIQAIMSVENNISTYGYDDYLWVLSKSVGNGSDWQGYGFATWGMSLVTSADNPATKLDQMQPIYYDKLIEIMSGSE